MITIEKIFWYLNEYKLLFSLSFFYFIALSWSGYFLILRRSVIFGITLTNMAQFSFVLGASLYSYYVGDILDLFRKSEIKLNHTKALLELDFFILPIFFIGLGGIIFFIEKLGKPSKHPEIILASIFIFLSGLSHLSYQFFQVTDLVISKAYFTELLYTHPKLLLHYLKILLPLLILFIFLERRFLLLAFDSTQMRLLGLSTFFYNFIFYTLVGFFIILGLRVLGFYLSLATLFIPPFVALNIFRKKETAFIMTALLTIGFISIGFMLALIWDHLPTEPLLIVSMGILAILVKCFSTLIKSTLLKK